MMKPTIVVALGGNALLRRGDQLDCPTQLKNIKIAASAIARLSRNYRVAIVHGNGPQVGLLALQNLAYSEVSPYPLDVLGAESQGMIGYLLTQELNNLLTESQITTLLTRIEVDPNDPSMQDPSKFVGPIYSQEQAATLAEQHGWTVKADGNAFRRVVASPKPKNILDKPAIQTLLAADGIVICCGGGGIPVQPTPNGYQGVEGVIDKDLAAQLLAQQLDADKLMILTDADAVYLKWGTPGQQALNSVSVEELKQYNFAAGSMGPKVEAACQFVRATGSEAYIGSLEHGLDVLAGKAGTRVYQP
nr:carbamate kinase [Dongshaea marina]